MDNPRKVYISLLLGNAAIGTSPFVVSKMLSGL